MSPNQPFGLHINILLTTGMPTLNCCFSCLVLQSTTTKEQKNHCSRMLLKAVGEGSLLPGSIQQTKQKKQELSQFSNICNKMFPWSLCSGWISAVGFPCDLWTSTGTTQKHMSGVRRRSVNKCLLHKYDDWSLSFQHLYIKKKPGTAVHTCNPTARRQRQEDPWAIARYFAWTTKKTPGAVRVSIPKVR